MRFRKFIATAVVPGVPCFAFAPSAVDGAMEYLHIAHNHTSNLSDYLSNPVYLVAGAVTLAATSFILSAIWDGIAYSVTSGQKEGR